MSLQLIRHQKNITVILEGKIKGKEQQLSLLTEELKNTSEINFSSDSLIEWDSLLASAIYTMILNARQKNISVDLSGLPKDLKQLIDLALAVDRKPQLAQSEKLPFLENLGNKGLNIFSGLQKSLLFIYQITLSFARWFSGKALMRKIDLEFALEDCSYKAFGIISLVSFMVGLILAFVGALQLKMFGAQIYVASLVTIGMTRIIGAIMTGIIMAGRTGASYAATIGTMQVNEEIDALKTFGFNVTDFLILPRFLSLILTMPILTMVSDIMGILGGAFVGIIMLDISAAQYLKYSLDAFSATNFLVGLFHGLIYGIIIACCGCYYGINCGRNADSVGIATTKAVVSSIVIMIVATGFLTLIFQALRI